MGECGCTGRAVGEDEICDLTWVLMDLDSAEEVEKEACQGWHTRGLQAPEMPGAVGRRRAHGVDIDLYALGRQAQGTMDSEWFYHAPHPSLTKVVAKMSANAPACRGTAEEALATLEDSGEEGAARPPAPVVKGGDVERRREEGSGGSNLKVEEGRKGLTLRKANQLRHPSPRLLKGTL